MIFTALFAGLASGFVVFVLGRVLGPGGAISEEKNIKKRLAASTSSPAARSTEVRKKELFSDIEILKGLLKRYKISDKIAVLLNTIRLKISVSVFLCLCLVMGLVCFLLFQLWLSPLVALAFAIFFGLIPYLYLRHRRKRYLAKFAQGLPDALSIISNSIKAGHSLEVAIEMVSQSASYPVSEEFGIARAEMRLGIPLPRTLENLDKRINNNELKILITGISIQQELGGNLSEILDNMEKTIRERFAITREIGTLSAQGKYSAWILLLIPLGLIAIYLKSNPKLFIHFINSSYGGTVLWLSLACDVVGFIWIRYIVKLQD